jgi:hypothetical protein
MKPLGLQGFPPMYIHTYMKTGRTNKEEKKGCMRVCVCPSLTSHNFLPVLGAVNSTSLTEAERRAWRCSRLLPETCRKRGPRQHTSAYVSIRQHTYVEVFPTLARDLQTERDTSAYVSIRMYRCSRLLPETCRQRGIRQHTSAYVSIRQHTSAYVRIRQYTYVEVFQALARDLQAEGVTKPYNKKPTKPSYTRMMTYAGLIYTYADV